MEELINTQANNADPQEVYELILDKFRGSQISTPNSILLSKFTNLESLSLNYCGLKSLENFPILPNLIKLELCDNKLKSNLQILSTLTSLTILSLAGNQIENIQELAPLSCLENLKTLDLFGNPLTGVKDYTGKVFEMFRNLQVLDGYDKDGEEVSVASEESESEDEEEESSLGDFIESGEEEQEGGEEQEGEEKVIKRPRKPSQESEVKCKNEVSDD